MPKTQMTDLTVRDKMLGWAAELIGGDATEHLLDVLKRSEEYPERTEDDVRLLAAIRAVKDLCDDIETNIKDAWWKEYHAGRIEKSTEWPDVFGTIKVDCRDAGEPKTTPGDYIPNRDFLWETYPPGAHPNLWTWVPGITTPGSKATVAVTLPKKRVAR